MAENTMQELYDHYVELGGSGSRKSFKSKAQLQKAINLLQEAEEQEVSSDDFVLDDEDEEDLPKKTISNRSAAKRLPGVHPRAGKKRNPNTQPLVDALVAHAAAKGFTVFYDRKKRRWVVMDKKDKILTEIESRDFADLTIQKDYKDFYKKLPTK